MKMKFLTAAISASALLMSAPLPGSAEGLSDLDGNAFIFNPKTQQFLGVISSDRYSDKSICNRYGDYGSKYSDLSLLSQYGDYGSRYSDFSAYNPRAEYPPIIISSDGEPLAVVSVNSKWEGIHPGSLFGIFCEQR